eukprot:TRINITY_DN19873_c0_g1_i2.p1 TRINITY_DN19873_c0_g1~~TRINITY_DN19873_c0_g1_i2.p1  ORF type:complete len:430 (-),score=79.68 TRINITY_DN19873_c0_g1_i2:493-1782(-)
MGRPLPPLFFSATYDKEVIVLLGMPGPWAEDNAEASDHYTTKIGGVPDWPISADEINPDLLKCGVCGGKLALVAQVYSPLDTNQIYIEERILYVFGCPSLNCGINPLSWRTIRLQRHASPELSQSHSVSESFVSEGSSSTNRHRPRAHTFDDSNIEEELEQSSDLDEWWDDDIWSPSSDGEDSNFYGSLDMQELTQALQDAGHVISNPFGQNVTNNSVNQIDDDIQLSNQNADNQIRDVHSINDGNNVHTINLTVNNFPVLPCFYIYYQNEIPLRPGCSSQSDVHSRQYSEVGDVDDYWDDDEFEPGRTLNAEQTSLKFKKRLDCCPEQCFRYCFGGRPLLANTDRGDPGICALCGGPRVYEMQLMPPILYYLQQACKDMPSVYSANNWEWSTIIVYTCAQSCTGERERTTVENDWAVVEEATIVQYET